MKSHKKGKSQDPKVAVSLATLEKLKSLKVSLTLKNMDEVINHLIDPPSASREEAASSSSEDDGGEAPQKKRKKNVREPLFSFEDLAERHEMLEYYTGFDESAIRLLIRRLGQVSAPDPGARRRSNEGFRKLDLEERVLIFLTRIRRKRSFKELGYLYGCGKASAQRYYEELRALFCTEMVPRLVFPRPPQELLQMADEATWNSFSDLLAVLDATNWQQQKPENFLLNRLSYSAYKHFVAFQTLLVVSTKRLVLWRSEIFGGISNEINVILDQSTLLKDLEAKGYLKKLEEDPEAVILLGDSAYNRSKIKGKLGIGLPVPLPKNGTQQKGAEVTASHTVQSQRAVVEQTIADLKLAKVLDGNKISEVEDRSKELDCVIGLHNLRVLLKDDPKYDIPARRAPILDDHVFKPLTPPDELDFKIPPEIRPTQEKNIAHIRAFERFLPSAAPALKKAVEIGGDGSVFFPTVGKRGRNLYNGAYVLHLRVQEEEMEVWTVKFLVGASYSYETHSGYFKISKDEAPKACICDCYSGARTCSHLNAVFRLLLDWIDPTVDTMLRVRKSPMPKPDFALRTRPLKEVEPALKKLKRVVLFHPDEIVLELPAKFCICGKGERKKGPKTKKMIQCDTCWEWFHYDCAGLKDDFEAGDDDWQCNWCENGADDQGIERWTFNRKKAKVRHRNDHPRLHGAVLGGDGPKTYSSPPSWEGKVAEVQEISRRKTIKKRKLKDLVEQRVDEGGHHMVDAEGSNGLEARPVDDALIDEMVGAGIVDPDAMSND